MKKILVIPDFSNAKAFNKNKVVNEIRKEIIEKEKLSKKLWNTASTMYAGSLGTAFNEVDADDHTCFILARLLNKDPRKFEVKYEIDLNTKSEGNGYSLQIEAQSLENYTVIAKRILVLSDDERIIEWNLDCAGRSGSDYIKEKKSTFYILKDQGETIQILGKIEDGFFQKLKTAISKSPKVKTIALGSGGGSVQEALNAGRYIRQRGLDTTLYNNCKSACPLVFMAGINRTIWSPYPSLQFHQIYILSNNHPVPIEFDNQIYVDIYVYLAQMGIRDPIFVISKMWSSPPESFTIVDPSESEELCQYNVATWIQRNCSADE